MIAKLGSRYYSAVCDTEVIVVKSSSDDVALTCGGRPMVAGAAQAPRQVGDPDSMGNNVLGKRYAGSGLEVLVVKSGAGTLAVNGVPMDAAPTRALPASD